jgi:hypothetical protein
MIAIDKVSGSTTYDFPTIDFKFQNTGSAAAFLWQFAVSILDAHINPTPVLDFTCTVENHELIVKATNYGWGDARHCEIVLDEPVITRLFPESMRCYNGILLSGEEEVITRLPKKRFTPKEIKSLSSELQRKMFRVDETWLWSTSSSMPKYTYGIGLESIRASWRCEDERKVIRQGIESVRLPGHGKIILTNRGFMFDRARVMYRIALSYVTYITIIDPSNGAHERIYPISHKIPPGDVERFHIMIGSSKSCDLRIKFKFSLDAKKIVESEEFNLELWNPKNSRLHSKYHDGGTLVRANESFPTDWY